MNQNAVLTVILNFRTPDLTIAAAQAALDEMQPCRGEVVVIDNGSGDDSFERLRGEAETRGWLKGGKLRVVASDCNGGFGAGMNIGFRMMMSDGSKPDFFYLLNSDAIPEPGAVQALLTHMTKWDQIGLCGSFVQGPDGAPHRTAFRFPSIAGEFEAAAYTGVVSRLLSDSIVAMEIPEAEGRVDWTAGASLLVRSDMIDDVGAFDETFFLYFEETDLCHRAMEAGWETHYVPQSRVVHIGSASTGMKSWDRVPQYWFDSRLHYFTKTHGQVYAGLATLARLSGGLIWRLRRFLQRRPELDAPNFLRDLLGHYVRSFKRGVRTRPAPRTFALTEDRK